jgi:ABC-type multidrug transport system fused ATPase/permease subunit
LSEVSSLQAVCCFTSEQSGPLDTTPKSSDENAENASPKKRMQSSVGSGKRQVLTLQMFLIVAVYLCFVWTMWLIMLNMAPNATINHVMRTQSFDDGAFWLLVEPPQRLVLVAAFGLLIVAVIYLAVFVKILVTRQRMTRIYLAQQEALGSVDSLSRKPKLSLKRAPTKARGGKVASTAAKMVTSLTHNDSAVRKTVVCTSFSVWYFFLLRCFLTLSLLFRCFRNCG